MKRDMDLAREILLKIEESPTTMGWVELDFPGRSDEEVSYHVKQLAQGGLIEAHDVSSHSGLAWKARSLTWEGHDFLDNARNEGAWQKTKAIVAQQGGGLSFEVVKAILLSVIKEQIGL